MGTSFYRVWVLPLRSYPRRASMFLYYFCSNIWLNVEKNIVLLCRLLTQMFEQSEVCHSISTSILLVHFSVVQLHPVFVAIFIADLLVRYIIERMYRDIPCFCESKFVFWHFNWYFFRSRSLPLRNTLSVFDNVLYFTRVLSAKLRFPAQTVSSIILRLWFTTRVPKT
jgi:hypothetical protein